MKDSAPEDVPQIDPSRQILYKYCPPLSARAILESSTLGFSRPFDFNDPLELLHGAPNLLGTEGRRAAFALQHYLNELYCVLSLARSPLNPLMWAHYASAHKGYVLGFRVPEAGLGHSELNVVPAHFGSVVYSSRPAIDIGKYRFRWHHASDLALYLGSDVAEAVRLFCYKGSSWSHEEEVRVVRRIFHSRPAPNTKTVNGRELFVWPFTADALAEVYFGIRNNMLVDQAPPLEGELHGRDMAKLISKKFPKTSIRICAVDDDLGITSRPLPLPPSLPEESGG